MKNRDDKSQLRTGSDERKESSPESLLNSSRRSALHRAASSHAAILQHSHTSPLTDLTYSLSWHSKFPPFKTLLSILWIYSVSLQWRKCVQATCMKITVWVGVGVNIQKEVPAAAQEGAHQPTLPES